MTGGWQRPGGPMPPTPVPGSLPPLPPGARVVVRIPPSPRQHVGYWFAGGVVAALIPFLSIIVHWADGSPNHSGFYEALGRGELLAIAMVITLSGLAELVPAMGSVRDAAGTGWLLLSAIFLGLTEGLWYTDVTSNVMDKHPLPLGHLAWGSSALFVMSVLISLRSVYVAASTR
jgi:hypothetical protein